MSAGRRELERCIRNPDETLGEFAQRLKVIANKMFPPSSVSTPAQTYHRDILLVNQFMDGIKGRLANEVSQSGECYSLDECLQEAEQCKEVVSRMGSPQKRTKRRQESPKRFSDNGANRFPDMRTRCLRCGEGGHQAVGCRRQRKLFCNHCRKEGAPCSLNSQQSSDQPNS
ncbi:hypothetical protein JTB14_005172 [Gonioctena quinquepunctata]|nr:hypothetical protein JTB14_005172 [Gonioctena quinquepunctata]